MDFFLANQIQERRKEKSTPSWTTHIPNPVTNGFSFFKINVFICVLRTTIQRFAIVQLRKTHPHNHQHYDCNLHNMHVPTYRVQGLGLAQVELGFLRSQWQQCVDVIYHQVQETPNLIRIAVGLRIWRLPNKLDNWMRNLMIILPWAFRSFRNHVQCNLQSLQVGT